jgi:hypothetical protein
MHYDIDATLTVRVALDVEGGLKVGVVFAHLVPIPDRSTEGNDQVLELFS